MEVFKMDKQQLKRRYDVYWARVSVPDSVRGIIGKSELFKEPI